MKWMSVVYIILAVLSYDVSFKESSEVIAKTKQSLRGIQVQAIVDRQVPEFDVSSVALLP